MRSVISSRVIRKDLSRGRCEIQDRDVKTETRLEASANRLRRDRHRRRTSRIHGRDHAAQERAERPPRRAGTVSSLPHRRVAPTRELDPLEKAWTWRYDPKK